MILDRDQLNINFVSDQWKVDGQNYVKTVQAVVLDNLEQVGNENSLKKSRTAAWFQLIGPLHIRWL